MKIGKKKINSSDNFQVNLSSKKQLKSEEQDSFNYGSFENKHPEMPNNEEIQNNKEESNNSSDINEKTTDKEIPVTSNNDVNSNLVVDNGYTDFNSNDASSNNNNNNMMLNNNANNNMMLNNNEMMNNYAEESFYDNKNENNEVFLPEMSNQEESLDNGDERIKKMSDAYKRARREQNCLVVVLMIIISIGCLFFTGIIQIVGAGICFLSVIGSIFKYQDRVKYSKAVLILSLLVSVSYVFSFVYINKYFRSDVDKVSENKFKDKAILFINNIRNEEIEKNHKVKCLGKGVRKVNFSLPNIDSDSYNSPFGGTIDQEKSYILVEAEIKDAVCVYTYSIYLTDGTYELGELYAPILEKSIENGKVSKK